MTYFLDVTSLPYVSDLTPHYRQFHDAPGFALLESTDSSKGRFDILSAYPYEWVYKLRTDPDVLAIFSILEKKMPLSDNALIDCELPFQGGFIGLFTYDLAEHLIGITPGQRLGDLTAPLVAGGFYDWAIITDHQLKTVSLFARHNDRNTRLRMSEIIKRWHCLDRKKQDFIIRGELGLSISAFDYEKAFNSVHEALEQGRCYQANLTQAFKLAFSGSPFAIYETIKVKNPTPYAAFLSQNTQTIASFSPERLFTMNHQRLMASPIKGSMKRDALPQRDEQLKEALKRSEKNRAENIMIVDLWRNDLGKIAKPGTVKVPQLCEIESYAAVHHLVSHIEADCLDNVTPWQALSHCFPGGSITGAPKREAMKVIAEVESTVRGAYCGSIGYVSAHGRLDMNISIRTLTLKNAFIHFFAGGGIVIDSECTEEYDECFIKIAAILRGLGL